MSNPIWVEVHHHHHFPDGGVPVDKILLQMEHRIMSQISDKIAALNTSVDSAISRVQADVQTMTQKIADLQALVDSGGASPDDLAAIDALQAKVDALDPTKSDVVTSE